MVRGVARSTEGRLWRPGAVGGVHSTPQRASRVGCSAGLARKSTSKLQITCVARRGCIACRRGTEGERVSGLGCSVERGPPCRALLARAKPAAGGHAVPATQTLGAAVARPLAGQLARAVCARTESCPMLLGAMRHGAMRCGAVRCGAARRDAVRSGTMRCGTMRHATVGCGAVGRGHACPPRAVGASAPGRCSRRGGGCGVHSAAAGPPRGVQPAPAGGGVPGWWRRRRRRRRRRRQQRRWRRRRQRPSYRHQRRRRQRRRRRW